jgi:hypothetical protein
MNDDEKIVLNTSDEAAQFKTGLSGWVSRHGLFFGKDERAARYNGCTHVECSDCKKPTERGWTLCEFCREKHAQERYAKRESKEWDGKTLLYSESADKYFFDEDDLMDFLADEGGSIESLRLLICEPEYLRPVEYDHWVDDLPEDGELPEAVEDAVEAVNKVIREQGPSAWYPGKYAAVLKEEQ